MISIEKYKEIRDLIFNQGYLSIAIEGLLYSFICEYVDNYNGNIDNLLNDYRECYHISKKSE